MSGIDTAEGDGCSRTLKAKHYNYLQVGTQVYFPRFRVFVLYWIPLAGIYISSSGYSLELLILFMYGFRLNLTGRKECVHLQQTLICN